MYAEGEHGAPVQEVRFVGELRNRRGYEQLLVQTMFSSPPKPPPLDGVNTIGRSPSFFL